MARAREAVPAIPAVQTIANSSSHVIRCICSRQFGVKLRRTRVIACVQCSSGRGSCVPSILAGMCHAAVIVSRQNVKIGKHHILVDRAVFEKSRVRCVSVDAADYLRGPDQHCSHVRTTFGWPPQFHPIGHARRNARPQDKQFCRRTQVPAALNR